MRAARICQAYRGGRLSDYLPKPYKAAPQTQREREIQITLDCMKAV